MHIYVSTTWSLFYPPSLALFLSVLTVNTLTYRYVRATYTPIRISLVIYTPTYIYIRNKCSRKNFIFFWGGGSRNWIWPFGSTHIFTQWGWLILFSPGHFSGQHQIGESPPNTFSSSEFFKKDRRTYWPFSSLADASRHNEESHLISQLNMN